MALASDLKPIRFPLTIEPGHSIGIVLRVKTQMQSDAYSRLRAEFSDLTRVPFASAERSLGARGRDVFGDSVQSLQSFMGALDDATRKWLERAQAQAMALEGPRELPWVSPQALDRLEIAIDRREYTFAAMSGRGRRLEVTRGWYR